MGKFFRAWINLLRSLPPLVASFAFVISVQLIFMFLGLVLLLINAVVPVDPWRCSADWGFLYIFGLFFIAIAGFPTNIAIFYMLSKSSFLGMNLNEPTRLIVSGILPIILQWGIVVVIRLFQPAARRDSKYVP